MQGPAAVFQRESATDAAFAHLTVEPDPPSQKAPRGQVSRDLDQLVMACLQ